MGQTAGTGVGVAPPLRGSSLPSPPPPWTAKAVLRFQRGAVPIGKLCRTRPASDILLFTLAVS